MASQTTIDAVIAALHVHPGLTANDVAEQCGLGRSTAAKALATLERQDRVHRVSDTGEAAGGRKAPAGWRLTTVPNTDSQEAEPIKGTVTGNPNPASAEAPDADHEPAAAAFPEAAPAAVGGGERLRKGRLREMVLAQLQADPDAEHTPTALSRTLGHSSGAIANALVRLTLDGKAVETSSRPRRYIATPRRAA